MAAELESGLLQYELVTALQFLQNGKTPDCFARKTGAICFLIYIQGEEKT